MDVWDLLRVTSYTNLAEMESVDDLWNSEPIMDVLVNEEIFQVCQY